MIGMMKLGFIFLITAHGQTVRSDALGITNDAYVRGGQYGDNNNGLSSVVRVRNSNSSDARYKSYLEADLGSALNPGEVFTNAAIRVTAGNTALTNAPVTLNIYGIRDNNDTWAESTVTWNNAPKNTTNGNGVISGGTVLLGTVIVGNNAFISNSVWTFSGSAMDQYLNWTAGAIADPYGNGTSADKVATFILVSSTLGPCFDFYSSEDAAGAGPELGYSTAPAAPDISTFLPVHNGSGYMTFPSFSWGPVPGAASYQIEITNSAGTLVASDYNLLIPRYVPRELLEIGNLYWRVRAVDQDGNSGNWSSLACYQLLNPANTYTINTNMTYAQIRDWIKAAVSNTPAKVIFAPGTYALIGNVGRDALFDISGARNLIIDGSNSMIIMSNSNRSGLFRAEGGTNITIKNFKIDYNPLPYVAGTVTAVTTTNLVIQQFSDPAMPAYNSTIMLSSWGAMILMDKNIPGKLKDDAQSHIEMDQTSLIDLGAGSFSVSPVTAENIGFFEVGDHWIQCARGWFLMTMNDVYDCTFKNITIYSSPNRCFSVDDGSDLKVIDICTVIADGRKTAVNAGWCIVRAGKVGPWIEGCEVSGTGDDGIALYNKGEFPVKKINDSCVLVTNSANFNFTAGDTFCIFNPRDGVNVAENLTVTSVTGPDPVSNLYTVCFEPPVSSVLVTTNALKNRNDQLFNRSKFNQHSMIRSNTLSGIRRFGAVLRCKDSVVEGNTFSNCSATAIALQNECATWNGGPCENMTIRNNTIGKTRFDENDFAAIDVMVGTLELREHALSRLQKNIHIISNRFENFDVCGISLCNTDGGTIQGNLFVSTKNACRVSGEYAGIYVDNCNAVSVLNNDLLQEFRPIAHAVLVTTNTSGIIESGNLATGTYYRIKNKYTGMILKPSGTTNDATIVQVSSDSTDLSLWNVQYCSSNRFQIVNKQTQMALKPSGSGDSAPLKQYTLTPTDSWEKWELVPAGDEQYYSIVNDYYSTKAIRSPYTNENSTVTTSTNNPAWRSNKYELIPFE
jgi:hypothetical protein